MKVASVNLTASHRQHVLSGASVELNDGSGVYITIHDVRILENKQGQKWVALPSYSVTKGRDYQYLPTIEMSASLAREISDAVLEAFNGRS